MDYRLQNEVTKEQLEEEGLIKLKVLDEEIAAFCAKVRKDMAWTDA